MEVLAIIWLMASRDCFYGLSMRLPSFHLVSPISPLLSYHFYPSFAKRVERRSGEDHRQRCSSVALVLQEV